MTEYLEWYKPFPIQEGQTIDFRCDRGFLPANQQTWQRATCINSRYEPEPKCFSNFDHGHFINHYGNKYIEDTGGKCGHPPPMENGDIVDSPKATYFPSETVTYQCQNFYTMEGSPRVTCQNGHWSQTPTCRVSCTASEEDMREHNIRLRWSNRNKIYSEDGNRVEFTCLRGYKPHPNTRSLRANCVDGKFDYPDCIPVYKLHYECKEGFQITNNTIDDTVTCTEKGWEPTPSCE
ncbi:Complement factor H, partial [Ophiophagus hannah]